MSAYVSPQKDLQRAVLPDGSTVDVGATRFGDLFVSDKLARCTLEEILKQLKIMNYHLSVLSDEENVEVENDV